MNPTPTSVSRSFGRRVGALLACAIVSTLCRSQATVVHDLVRTVALTPNVGADAAVISDLDGDGVADLVLGCPDLATTPILGVSQVQLRSGATGALIRTILPPANLNGACFGASVSVISDIDFDGKPDIAVGSPRPNGSVAGHCTMHSSATGSVLFTLAFPGATSAFGAVVRTIGDVNGDGRLDIVIADPGRYFTLSGGGGTPGYSAPITPRAFLASGFTGGLLRQVQTVPGSNFTSALQCPGDLDGDGFPDILYAIDHRIDAISGATGANLYSTQATSVYAPFSYSSFAVIDDRNGDGAREFVRRRSTSTPTGSIEVIDILSGRTGVVLNSIANVTPGDEAGFGLAAVGDQNGDGIPDWIATAPGTGSIHVYSGATSSRIRTIQVPGAGVAGVVALGTGDLSGDGVADFAVGGYGIASGVVEPRFVAIRGGSAPAVRFDVASNRGQDAFARSLASAGDLTGDGIPDLLAGSPGANPSERADAGAVALVSGATGLVVAEVTGTQVGGNLGHSVVSIGDVSGDGIPEFAAGAPNFRTAAGPVGEVIVFDGGTRVPRYTVVGSNAGGGFGATLAAIGDVDGDGLQDLVIGSRSVPATSGGAALVEVRSGSTGAVLSPPFTVTTGPGSAQALTLAVVGDQDGDAKEDIAVCGGVASPGTSATIDVRSPISGGLIRTLSASNQGVWAALGVPLANVGDVDGDGLADLAVGLSGYITSAPGTVALISIATGALIRTLSGPAGFGAAVAAVGDWNGDGVTDVGVGTIAITNTMVNPGVTVFSGADGSALSGFHGAVGLSDLGLTLAPCGDLDRDGFPELAVGAPWIVLGLSGALSPTAGRVVVLSSAGNGVGTPPFGAGCVASNGRVPTLRAIGGEPSVLTGNPAFGLVIGAAEANRPAALLLGASFTSWQGLALPLDLGAYGMGSCQLLVSPDIVVETTTRSGAGGVGIAAFPIPIPLDPQLYGFAVLAQAFVANSTGPVGAMTGGMTVIAQ